MNIEIEKINNSQYGELTILKIDNINYFLAKEIAILTSHSNVKQAINRLCLNNEFRIIQKTYFLELFNQLIENKIVEKKAAKIIILTGDGLFKFLMNCNSLPYKLNLLEWLQSLNLIKTDILFLKERKEIQFSQLLIPFINYFGYKVESQYTLESYRLDFYIPELSICIEFDEKAHIYSIDNDKKRDAFLNSKKIEVLRVKENDNFGEILGFIGFKIINKMNNIDIAKIQHLTFLNNLDTQNKDVKDKLKLKNHAFDLFQGMIELGIKPAELNE
jgi:very-short-patch-repair endonuclease